MQTGIPDETLFYEDAEQWVRKHMSGLTADQLEEELQTIRIMSLLDFYHAVADNYPELLDTLPKIPNILVADRH
jgi:hypothetical protein